MAKWKGGNLPNTFPGDLDPKENASYLAQLVGAQIYWNREFGKDDDDVKRDNDITDSHDLALTLTFMVHDPESNAKPYDGDDQGRYRYQQSYMKLNSDGRSFGLKGPDAVLTKVFKALLGRAVDTNKCDFDLGGADLEKYESLLDLPVLAKGVKDIPSLDSVMLDGEELVGRHCFIQFGYPAFGKGASARVSEKLKIIGAMAVPAGTGAAAKPKAATQASAAQAPATPPKAQAAQAKPAKDVTQVQPPLDSQGELPKHVQTIINRVLTPAPLSVKPEDHLGYLNHLAEKWGLQHLVELGDLTTEMARALAQFYTDQDAGRQMLMDEFVAYRKSLTKSKARARPAPEPEPEPDDLDDLLGAEPDVPAEEDLPF